MTRDAESLDWFSGVMESLNWNNRKAQGGLVSEKPSSSARVPSVEAMTSAAKGELPVEGEGASSRAGAEKYGTASIHAPHEVRR